MSNALLHFAHDLTEHERYVSTRFAGTGLETRSYEGITRSGCGFVESYEILGAEAGELLGSGQAGGGGRNGGVRHDQFSIVGNGRVAGCSGDRIRNQSVQQLR
jgi:hypothetical protein